MMERNLVFCNGNAYDLTATMAWITQTYEEVESFPQHRYESMMTMLQELKYMTVMDLEAMLEDPHTGILMSLDLWMSNYGFVDHRVDYYMQAPLGDWSISDTTLDDYEGEECITSEDEDELLIGVAVLAALNAETQNLATGRVLNFDDIESLHESDLEYSDYD